MKFLGRAEIAAFSVQHPSCAEDLRVWLAEVTDVTWADVGALLNDYPRADAAGVPKVIFFLGLRRLPVETLVDFRNRIVLLTDVGRPAAAMSNHIQEDWTAYRDY